MTEPVSGQTEPCSFGPCLLTGHKGALWWSLPLMCIPSHGRHGGSHMGLSGVGTPRRRVRGRGGLGRAPGAVEMQQGLGDRWRVTCEKERQSARGHRGLAKPPPAQYQPIPCGLTWSAGS